jgi:hypothetical protein
MEYGIKTEIGIKEERKMAQAVVEYNVTDAAIAKMENQYMGLTITGIDDEDGFKAVHDARMIVKGHRVAVEKKRKELKADALAWGKKVDAEAKRIKGKLEPIESHLIAQEKIVADEKKRIKEAEEEKQREIIQNRVDLLGTFNKHLPFFDVASMSNDEWDACLKSAKSEYDAEQERFEKERLERAAEEKRISDERAELDRLREEQKKRDAAAKAEQDRIAKEQAEKEAALQAERDKLEAEKKAEQDRKDQEELEKRLAAEAKEKAEREVKEKAELEENERIAREKEKARQESLRPDKEKLLAFAQFLQEGITYPELKSPEANTIRANAAEQIFDIGEEIIQAIEGGI